MLEDLFAAPSLADPSPTNIDMNLQAPKAKLSAMVNEQIAECSFDFDGQKWAQFQQKTLAQLLGVSEKALRGLLSSAPFNYDVIINENGTKITLVRIGPKGPLTPRTIAKGMKLAWQDQIAAFNSRLIGQTTQRIEDIESNLVKFNAQVNGTGPSMYPGLDDETGNAKASSEIILHEKLLSKNKSLLIRAKEGSVGKRKVNGKEFGCMVGLAEQWGPAAPKVLKQVILHWSAFLSCTKNFIDTYENDLLDENGNPKLFRRFYDFPTLSYIRCFGFLAYDMLLLQTQEIGKFPLGINPKALEHNSDDHGRYTALMQALNDNKEPPTD